MGKLCRDFRRKKKDKVERGKLRRKRAQTEAEGAKREEFHNRSHNPRVYKDRHALNKKKK